MRPTDFDTVADGHTFHFAYVNADCDGKSNTITYRITHACTDCDTEPITDTLHDPYPIADAAPDSAAERY